MSSIENSSFCNFTQVIQYRWDKSIEQNLLMEVDNLHFLQSIKIDFSKPGGTILEFSEYESIQDVLIKTDYFNVGPAPFRVFTTNWLKDRFTICFPSSWWDLNETLEAFKVHFPDEVAFQDELLALEVQGFEEFQLMPYLIEDEHHIFRWVAIKQRDGEFIILELSVPKSNELFPADDSFTGFWIDTDAFRSDLNEGKAYSLAVYEISSKSTDFMGQEKSSFIHFQTSGELNEAVGKSRKISTLKHKELTTAEEIARFIHSNGLTTSVLLALIDFSAVNPVISEWVKANIEAWKKHLVWKNQMNPKLEPYHLSGYFYPQEIGPVSVDEEIRVGILSHLEVLNPELFAALGDKESSDYRHLKNLVAENQELDAHDGLALVAQRLESIRESHHRVID